MEVVLAAAVGVLVGVMNVVFVFWVAGDDGVVIDVGRVVPRFCLTPEPAIGALCPSASPCSGVIIVLGPVAGVVGVTSEESVVEVVAEVGFGGMSTTDVLEGVKSGGAGLPK